MTLLDLPHGKTQINESRKFNGKVDESKMEEVRGHPQETEEEQSQMEVTEADAEPEADQEEADQ